MHNSWRNGRITNARSTVSNQAAKAYDLPWPVSVGAHTSDNRSPVNEYEDRSGKKQQKWDHVMTKKNQNIEFK